MAEDKKRAPMTFKAGTGAAAGVKAMGRRPLPLPKAVLRLAGTGGTQPA